MEGPTGVRGGNREKVRGAGRRGPAKCVSEAEELRYRTLSRLEEVLRLLVDRHGARMTLGEMLAITASMSRICKQGSVSIAEIAEVTGLPKQNLSRWARKRIGDSISLKVNDDDQRMYDVVMLEQDRGQANIEKLARVLGTVRKG